MTRETQLFLLKLARQAILSAWKGRNISIANVPEEVRRKSGTFVTLTKEGELRGCIGLIEPTQEIYKGVIENARKAAFDDPRFPPVEENEVGDIMIEVSILSLPKKLEARTLDELTSYLEKSKPGLIIERGWAKATFLPQVWEELSNPEDFLNHLCRKAGLSGESWRNPSDLNIFEYAVEHFSEDSI